jgi:hypothetical protein
MAFPAVQTTAESATTTASTSHTVTMPSGVAAGDFLLILGAQVTTTDFTLAGWSELLNENVNRGGLVYAKIADGSEGASVTISSVGSTKPAWIAYRITGAADPTVTAPTLSTVATGTSVNPNATTCNPGVSADYLWISFYTLAGEEADDDTWTTSAPASYTNLLQKTAGTAGTNTSGVLASAERQLTASSEDAGSFTTVTSVNNTWRAFTIAIPPSPPVVPPPDLLMAPYLSSGRP